MMSYATVVKETISQYAELDIIDAHQIYLSKCKDVPEQTYYKTISRMTKSGEIARLTKGIYCRPKTGRFGRHISSEKQILEHYLGKDGKNGVVVGYRMYNKYKLTTQISKRIDVYSNVSEQEKKKVLDVTIKKANIKFDTSSIKMIELLDFLENVNKIEELNKRHAIRFIEDAAALYNDQSLEKLVRAIGYKKSTLASLRNVLDYYKINHSIGKYLNSVSKYKSMKMEDLNEFTP
jgi:hypothetical protein